VVAVEAFILAPMAEAVMSVVEILTAIIAVGVVEEGVEGVDSRIWQQVVKLHDSLIRLMTIVYLSYNLRSWSKIETTTWSRCGNAACHV